MRYSVMFAVPLCAVALALTARGQEPPTATAPVPLPPVLKTPLLKRVSIDKTPPATVDDLVKRLAQDNKIKIEFDPAFLKEYPDVAKRKVPVSVVKDIRLDLLIDGLVRSAGAVPTCVVKKDAIVFVKPADATTASKKAVQTLLQPPDAGHAAAVAALKKRLATKVDQAASNETPLFEFLIAVARKHELTFQLKGDLFLAEGEPNIAEKKPMIKAAKDASLDSVLRDTLKSVKADFVIDAYGNLSVVPKSAVPKK